MDGVFSGVRIIEFGMFVAGPYASEMFAHGGADVIKVEPVSGDATRFNSTIVPGEGRAYIIKARGKRGLPLNLRHEQGRAIARRLALQSDVLISNMRPGLLKRLGLDYESLSAENPRIIVGEISAMGPEGPYGNHAGADFQASAASGLMLASASFEGEEARFVDAFPSDFMAGTLLAFGIASALYRREHSGRGQHVRTSLYQAGLAVQHATANVFDAVDGWKREYAQWMQDERPHPREAAARRRRQSPVMVGGLYQTKDDRWITLGSSKRAFERMLDILGLDDPSVSDPAWEMPDDPHEHFTALRRRIRAVVLQFDGEDLRERLQQAGVPCSLLESLEEAMLGEHARANGFVHRWDHPTVGPVTMAQAPLSFSADHYSAAEHTPAFGEHLRELLTELGYGGDEIDQLIADGAVAEQLP